MRVGVIGGGLAGLAAAYDLVNAGAEVTLFNDTLTLGGQIRTRRDGGFVIEEGAEGWVTADTDVPDLCAALGIEAELVQQLERRSLYLSGGRLTELSSGNAARLLGIPAKDSDLGQGIASMRSGMAALTDSLAIAIRQRSTWRLGKPVGSVTRRGDGWEVTSTRGEGERVNAIVLAAPAPRAAAMIESISRDAAAALRRIEFVSNVSVSLGYERTAIGHQLNASGFVVDAAEQLNGLRACAFSSSKFPGRAPEQRALLRVFFRPDAAGGPEDDHAWTERAADLLAPVLEISQPPLGAWVARWPSALPQYSPEHREIIDEATRLLQKVGRIQVAGTSYHPSGVPGSVRSGRAAARAILAG